MGMLAKAVVSVQFKLGIYYLKQVLKIERGGVVINNTDTKYQPSDGTRYELSPDAWFLYSYWFFPKDHYGYDEEFLTRELYYDYYAKSGPAASAYRYYAIYKNGLSTGYFVKEKEYGGETHSPVTSRKFFSGFHIYDWGTSVYQNTQNARLRLGQRFERSMPTDAAICLIADVEDFEKVKINLASLKKDCEEEKNSRSCILHSKLTKLLPDCHFADNYIDN